MISILNRKQTKNSFFGVLIFAVCLSPIWKASASRADEPDPASTQPTTPEAAPVETSSWKLIKEKLRVRTFTEFMTPALSQNGLSVPDTDSNKLMPTNLFNIFWTDYEIAPDWKIVYWQRFWINLTADGPGQGLFQGMEMVPRNPRFALRKVNVFNVPNLSTTYDLYFQPGTSPEGYEAGRTFEMGFRTSTNYDFPGSKFNIGGVTEFTTVMSASGGPSPSIYGWLMAWLGYSLNTTFSTQHVFVINFQNNRNKPWYQLEWDLPKPYMQNGIGINVTKDVWCAVFINNYLLDPPTLKNTWASLWVAVNFL